MVAVSPSPIRSGCRTSALTGSRYDEDRVSVNSNVLHVLEPRDALTRSERTLRVAGPLLSEPALAA